MEVLPILRMNFSLSILPKPLRTIMTGTLRVGAKTQRTTGDRAASAVKYVFSRCRLLLSGKSVVFTRICATLTVGSAPFKRLLSGVAEAAPGRLRNTVRVMEPEVALCVPG